MFEGLIAGGMRVAVNRCWACDVLISFLVGKTNYSSTALCLLTLNAKLSVRNRISCARPAEQGCQDTAASLAARASRLVLASLAPTSCLAP